MTNNFIPFCPTDTGTNLLTNGEYAADTDRTSGQKPGVASSKLNNKALRQSSIITSQLAEVTSGQLGVDMLDTGATYAAIFNSLKALVAPLPPEVQKFTSGSGTWNKTYKFFIASGNATAGDTYTNNSVTYTVVSTIASGTILTARGSGAPEVSGTLTKSAGSGDATLTFYAVRAPVSINVEMVGGGGGGGGGGSNASQGTAGGTGGNTTFGTTLLVANGSGGGNVVGQGPATPPGTASLGTGPLGVAVSGAYGATGQQGNITGTNLRFSGGSGGNTPFGGAGGGGGIANNGVDAATNSGSGGGGGGATSSTSVGSGGGGGAGAYVKATINNPSATYAYAVGAGGTAGTAGTGGGGGGAGAAGVIVVTEHYQ